MLAAIRDEKSRRQAQYAIPEGKIALTQGFIPIDDYIESCHKEDDLTIDGFVTGCDDELGHPIAYNTLFVNVEGTKVPSGDAIWEHDTFPLDDGLLNAAIGADGILRPVKIWLGDSENNKNGYDGAVFECCPSSAANTQRICSAGITPPDV